MGTAIHYTFDKQGHWQYLLGLLYYPCSHIKDELYVDSVYKP